LIEQQAEPQQSAVPTLAVNTPAQPGPSTAVVEEKEHAQIRDQPQVVLQAEGGRLHDAAAMQQEHVASAPPSASQQQQQGDPHQQHYTSCMAGVVGDQQSGPALAGMPDEQSSMQAAGREEGSSQQQAHPASGPPMAECYINGYNSSGKVKEVLSNDRDLQSEPEQGGAAIQQAVDSNREGMAQPHQGQGQVQAGTSVQPFLQTPAVLDAECGAKPGSNGTSAVANVQGRKSQTQAASK
jgi:hypothetical protein